MATYSSWKKKKPKARPKPKAKMKAKPKPRVLSQVGMPPGWLGAWQKQSDSFVTQPKPLAPKPPPRAAAPPKAVVAPPPKPLGPQPLPFDPQYESTVGNARRQYDTTNAGLLYQENRTKQDYGFDDASDPFSKARMLERNFQQATRGRLNTAGNNLYSSSFNRGEEVGRFNYEGDVNTTRKSYADALQAITQQRAQAATDKTGTETSASADRIRRAQEDRQAAADRAAESALNAAQIAEWNRASRPEPRPVQVGPGTRQPTTTVVKKKKAKPKPKPKAKPKKKFKGKRPGKG